MEYRRFSAEDAEFVQEGKPFVRVCPLASFPVGRTLVVRFEEDEVALFHRPEGIFAVSNYCAHQHVPVLADGHVEGLKVWCPRHGWCYDLLTGRAVEGSGRLRVYEVLCHQGWLYLECPIPLWER
jgi:nitrite reductase/ring-hydroxylating ferredoxin subunit